MAELYVSYPGGPGARFDRDYYVAEHLPMVEREWGPTGLRSARAYFPASDDAGHVAIALLDFADDEAIAASLASDATGRVLGDLPNFTDAQPVLRRGTAP